MSVPTRRVFLTSKKKQAAHYLGVGKTEPKPNWRGEIDKAIHAWERAKLYVRNEKGEKCCPDCHTPLIKLITGLGDYECEDCKRIVTSTVW